MAPRLGTEAVSALFATVLLVVITVAVAGLVLYMGQSLGTPEGDPIDITFLTDEPDNSLQVVSVRPRAMWEADVEIYGSCTPTLNGGAYPPVPDRLVEPGDILGCQKGDTIRVAVVYGRGEQIIYDGRFS